MIISKYKSFGCVLLSVVQDYTDRYGDEADESAPIIKSRG